MASYAPTILTANHPNSANFGGGSFVPSETGAMSML